MFFTIPSNHPRGSSVNAITNRFAVRHILHRNKGILHFPAVLIHTMCAPYDEGSLRLRVARAQEIISPHPLFREPHLNPSSHFKGSLVDPRLRATFSPAQSRASPLRRLSEASRAALLSQASTC